MGYRLASAGQSRLARIAQGIAFLSLPMGVIAIMVTRSGKVDPIVGIGLVVVVAVMAAIAIAVASVAALEIWKRGVSGLAEISRVLAVGVLVLGYPGYLTVQAIRLPPINDVSTDIDDAPVFSRSSAVLEARGGHVPETLEPRQRARQGIAYPRVKPLLLEAEPDDVFETVRDAVRSLKWAVIEDVTPGGRQADGRLEAISETTLMRFKNDITIRVRKQGNFTRVDIRSASRLGRHDFGDNARRILRLIEEIAANRE